MKNYSNLKTLSVFVVLQIVLLSCSSSTADDTTEPVSTQYDITTVLSKFNGTGLVVSVNGNTVTFATQNLPDHESPYWPSNHALYEPYDGTNANFNLNPNRISSHNIVITVPLNPSEASSKQTTSLGPIGMSINGIVFYNQYAGPDNQPLTNEINSFDQFLGHPQNTGQYHYHVEPTYLTCLLYTSPSPRDRG